jgi:hypothetical protein
LNRCLELGLLILALGYFHQNIDDLLNQKRLILHAIVVHKELEQRLRVLEDFVHDMKCVDDMVKRTIETFQNLQENDFDKRRNLLFQVFSKMFHQVRKDRKTLRKDHFFL